MKTIDYVDTFGKESTKDYESETVFVSYSASGGNGRLEELIGKKVKRIENSEYHLKIIFEDDSFIESSGDSYDGAPLDVKVEITEEED